MSKRKIIPPGRTDRLLLFGSSGSFVLFFFIGWWFIQSRVPGWQPKWYHWVEVVLGILLFWAVVYRHQDDRSGDEFQHYTVALSNIEDIGGKLSELVIFLKREQQRVEDSRLTISRLQNEKTELEPVVLAQRDTVNAILSAYAKTTSSKAWKERAVGFVSGLLASLLAAIVFEFFRR